MNRIIEIIRKLSIVFICGSLGLIGFFLAAFSNAETSEGKSDRIFGFILLAAAFVAYKVINWVFGNKHSSE